MKHEISRRDFGQPSIAQTATRVVLLLFACLPLLGGCDGLLSAERRIDRAHEEFEAGNYVAAMSDLKTALSAEPDNIDGRVLLARVALRLGDVEAARKELDSAIALGADPAEVRGLHYEVLLAQNKFDDVLISAAADDGLDPLRRLVIMARADIALGKLEDAEESVHQALEMAPEDSEAALVQGRLYLSSGRLDEARATLDALLKREPSYGEAWVLQGRVALAGGDNARAREAFEKAKTGAGLQLSVPQQGEILVALVETNLALGDTAGADAHLAALRQLAPSAFVTRYLTARLAYAKGQNQAAIAELQRALAQRPDIVPARLLLGAALLADGSIEQAEAELDRLVADDPGNIEARRLLARLHLSRNDAAAARRVLADVSDTTGQGAEMDWLAGTVLLISGQTAEGIERLERGAEAEPGNVGLQLDLVQAYLLDGRADKARAVLAGLPEGKGGAQRSRLEVLVEIIGLDPAEAKPRIEKLVEQHGSDAGMLAAAANFLLRTGDTRGAAKVFEKAVDADPKSVDAKLGLAGSALALGDIARADEQLRSVLEIDGSNERAYVGLAYAATQKGDRVAARNWLERAVGAKPSAVEARLQLVEMAIHDGDLVRARAIASQVLDVTGERAATLSRLGDIFLGAAQYDDALKMFDEAAGLGDRNSRIKAGAALLAQGRADEARVRFEAAARERKEWVEPVVYLVAMDSSAKRYDQALARIAAFQDAGGPVFVVDEMRGNVLSAAGQQADALASFKKAAAARPSSGLAIKILRTSHAAGLPNPEKSVLDWLERNPEDQGARLAVAEYYQMTGKRSAAIAEYERLFAVTPSPAVRNNLAWLYHEIGDNRAEEFAREAHDAAPDNALIADTYGWILVEKGKVKEGLLILEAALAGLPRHPEVRYHHAVALARDGQKKPAADALRSLLADSQAFASRAEAQALLDKLSREELGL